MQVVAEKLAVRRGEDLIFDDVSFELNPEEALIVSGRNGVGKSTLLRCLSGLIPVHGGYFAVRTDDAEKRPPYEYCHYVGHSNAMKPELTIAENLEFWRGAMVATEDDLTVEKAVERIGLSHALDLPFGLLSQGQQRRVALARLMVSYRRVWLLDEPTAALDTASAVIFSQIINDHLKEGGIAVIATHLPLGTINPKYLEMTRPNVREEEYF